MIVEALHSYQLPPLASATDRPTEPSDPIGQTVTLLIRTFVVYHALNHRQSPIPVT